MFLLCRTLDDQSVASLEVGLLPDSIKSMVSRLRFFLLPSVVFREQFVLGIGDHIVTMHPRFLSRCTIIFLRIRAWRSLK